MKRRDFLTASAITTAGISSLFISCKPGTSADTKAKEKTNDQLPAFELDETDISSLQEKMAAGAYTSEKITDLYLARIRDIDHAGPSLHSVIEINPDAIADARVLDEERKSGKTRGPLHGIPVLLKDNIDTAGKMQTTAGSLALEGHIAATDAFLVKKLRDAGAVILGKTNLSEWANFRSNRSCSGWSSRGGQTKNPYILDHNPCGSSSGSGVAVAANLCVVAVGTETDGSITCPSAVNGIVGIKPTVGLVSRSGIIPISSTQDTAGPMARTVKDAAVLLGVLAGIDKTDKATLEQEKLKTRTTDYTSFLHPEGLKGKRIGIEKKPQGDNPLLHALQQKALEVLKQQGATIIEIEYLDAIGKLGDAEFELMQYEFKDGLNRYLAGANARVKTLEEVIAFNKANESKAMPYFKQELLESSQKKEGLDSPAYKQAVQKSHTGTRKIIDDLFKQHQLDALAGLTMGPACSIDMIYGDRWGNVFLTQPAAASGYPHITVPCGMAYDLPVGFSFFAQAYSEPALIEMGYAYEQATKNRKVPAFRKAFLP
ncbi:MAG TPA: amidase [Chitinophagaceae bacterium]|nr:amidase [Chitinophagaceae bacterium]